MSNVRLRLGGCLLSAALAMIVVALPRAQPIDQESAVIQSARDIATAVQQLTMTEDPVAIERFERSIQDGLARLEAIPNAAEILERVLQERRSYLTSCAAAYALYRLDESRLESSVNALLDQMHRLAFADQMLAEHLILAIGRPAVPVLIRHLDNSMVLNVLGSMGPEAQDAVPALSDLLTPGNVEVARALAQIGTEEAVTASVPILTEAARNPSHPYAKLAVISLGELGPEAREAIPVVKGALNAVDPDTRVYAAIALSQLDDVEASVAALADIIRDRENHMRPLALRTLGSLGPQATAAIPALADVLLNEGDKRFEDRLLAAQALLEIDPTDQRANAALEKAAELPALRTLMEREGLVPR